MKASFPRGVQLDEMSNLSMNVLILCQVNQFFLDTYFLMNILFPQGNHLDEMCHSFTVSSQSFLF